MKGKIKKHMMATTAIHKSGDISRPKPDLCIVFEEDDGNYYGNWCEGYGFINVRFPKETTRTLTEEEVKTYEGLTIMMNSTPMGKVKILR